MQSGKRLCSWEGGGIIGVAFSPDGRTLAAVSGDGSTAALWDIQSGKRLRSLEGNKEVVISMTFSLDSHTLATGSMNGTVALWDMKNGKHLISLKGYKGWVTSVFFSPDGRTLATGSVDGPASLWDVQSGKHLRSLEGHKEGAASVAFSPDGRILATGGSFDKTIALWDIQSGKRSYTLKQDAFTVTFSPDSRTLAFSTDKNAIGIWDLEDNINEFSGISIDKNGEYKIDLNTLPYKLKGLELKPDKEKVGSPDQPARWSKYHPFHWLPKAEAGDSNAMLQIGIIYDRNNDLARALRWYQKAIKAGNAQAKAQQDILLHWLEDKDNWQTVPGPFRDSFCKAKAEFELPEKVRRQCEKK